MCQYYFATYPIPSLPIPLSSHGVPYPSPCRGLAAPFQEPLRSTVVAIVFPGIRPAHFERILLCISVIFVLNISAIPV